ncbi:amidase domain-containing protein [Oscillospiraceae bacterium 50-60]
MKRMNKIIAMLLAAATILSLSAMASFSPEEVVVDRALEEVTGLYTNVYAITDASAYLLDQTTDEYGNTVYMIETSFKRTLKAASALEIPAIIGMVEAKSQLEDPAEIQAAEEYIAARIADMEENYIGVEQDTNVMLRVTIPAAMPASASLGDVITHETIEVECGIGEEEYGPLEGIAPRSAADQQETGSALVTEAVNSASMMAARETTRNSAILDYNRIAARNYARWFSCDEGISTDHPSCHNGRYEFFDGNDCANFVSQCLENGGLTRDSQWYPYSSYWNTTGNNGAGLRQYITKNDLFFRTTNVNKAFAGSIINQLKSNGSNAGHVGLIDQNDFSTVTFCAHTNCRSSRPVSFIGYKDYYVPYYDSYGDVWVNP